MAGKGQVYRRHDGNWAWRIKAANGQIVATDGSQGYPPLPSARPLGAAGLWRRRHAVTSDP